MNDTPVLTLRQALALTGDDKSSGIWVHHLPCDDPNEPERLSRYSTAIAVAWHGDAVVRRITPFIDPNPEKTGPDDAEHPDFYRGNVYAVEPAPKAPEGEETRHESL